MQILDRLRRRPDWEHSDALVRASAVRQLGSDQRDLLASIARSDDDGRVRRAAVKRLGDPELLAEIAKEDEDDAVREAATGVLLGLAVGGSDAATCQTALVALSEPKHLTAVARGARLEEVRLAALSRIQDPRSLAAVAKTAAEALTRRAALEAISDAAILEEVALKTEHKDVGLAALERIDDEKVLEGLAAKARQKAVSRRAKARLIALAEKNAGPAVQPSADDIEKEQALYEHAKAEHERELHERAGQHDARLALCAQVEALSGTNALEGLKEAMVSWRSLPPISGPEGEELERRFESVCEGCRRRHGDTETLEARRPRLEELCQELEALAGSEAGAEGQRTPREVRSAWATLASEGPVDEALAARFEAAAASLEQKRATAREEKKRSETENKQRLEGLCQRIETLVGSGDIALRDAEHGLRDLRAALAEPGPLPSKTDRETLSDRLRAARSALFPKAQELREADEWSRWANVSVQEELCRRTEALLEATNLEQAARELREIDETWKQARKVPKEQADPLWQRFKAAREQIRARCSEHFARKATEQAENLGKKRALCEQAESLAESTDWVKTAAALQKLQAEWKQVGPVPRRQSEAVWRRFRKACDTFFNHRKADLAERKQTWAKNLESKEALCGQAEALIESTEWEPTSAELRRLQAEWKQIGPVRRNQSDAVWRRFRKACDAFFERYKNRGEIARAAKRAEQEAICADLEGFFGADPASGDAVPEDLPKRLADLVSRWRQVAPSPQRAGDDLAERFEAALERVVERQPSALDGTDLDPKAGRARMERLCARVEALLPPDDVAEAATDAEALGKRLREALATNTLGGRGAAEERLKSVADELRAAKAAWDRLGLVPGAEARASRQRFEQMCSRIEARLPPSSRRS